MDNTTQLENWLQQFKLGKTEAINWLYENYRDEFVMWVLKRHQCTEEEAIDVFQDSVIAFYRNVRLGKIIILQSSIKTYLFGIGKNLLLKRFRAKRLQTVSMEKTENVVPNEEEMPYEKLQNMERVKLIRQLLQRMKEPCRSILKLFYFKKYAMEAIQNAMNYNSLEVVKTQKKRCMKRLRGYTAKYYEELR